ncbi:MAG: 6-phosphofructokinase [Myxococcales bacterium FL481]|nr:MAG: 6-phosphofructokinase [Myxococcales bacterium FL481]
MSGAGTDIGRVGLVFSGGPAPAANAVISAAATPFVEGGCEVLGIFHGYSNLQNYDADESPLVADEHYRRFAEGDLRGLRNQRGIIVGTARANPGKPIAGPEDLHDPVKNAALRRVYTALVDLGLDALISIGGDDTLKTANFLYEYQKRLPPAAPRVRVVHVPKTIDNDYHGIDFTFGYFTAVDVMAKELMNLRADAMATSAYYVVETMGRKAAWLSYGVAIAGEAHLVLGVEDIGPELCVDGPGSDGGEGSRRRLSLDKLAEHIVTVMAAREERKKFYGTVVLAEGLSELLAEEFLQDIPRDDHGHLALSEIPLAKMVAKAVRARYEARFGRKKKVTGVVMGYESRCSPPHAFDVLLGSQLGTGAYRALVEEGLDGHMVSVQGQFELHYVPFSQLVDPQTLRTQVRLVPPGSDFHRLARFLETRVDSTSEWDLGRRHER